MDDHSDDMRRPLPPRMDIYTGGGRKRWPVELKAQMVAESFEAGAVVAEVARHHGCRAQQLHGWRRMARLGHLVLPASTETPFFVPLVAETAEAPATESAKAAVITVEVFGARVEVRAREEERNRQEQRLLSGADCKWTQFGKSRYWYCRANARTFRLSPTKDKMWHLHRVKSVSDDDEGDLVGKYRRRGDASKVVNEMAYQPESRW